MLRVEDLIDKPVDARAKLLQFLDLPAAPASLASTLPLPGTSYASLHATSLRSAKAQPMLNSTRAAAESFYAPYNAALGELLGWPKEATWLHSTVVDAKGIASAAMPTRPARARQRRRGMRRRAGEEME